MSENEKTGIDWWLSLLKDKDPKVRKKAVQALGEIRNRRAFKPLTTALKDRDAAVRAHAVIAVSRFKDPLRGTL